MSPSSLSGSRPVPKCSSAKRKPSLRRLLGEFLGLAHVLSGDLLGHLDAQPLRLDLQRFQLRFEPADQALVEYRVLRDAHENAGRLAVRSERHRGADDPAVDVLHQIVALRRGNEFGRKHLVALFVEHAHQHVEHSLVLAEQARDRLLHQPEAVLHQRALDVLDPDLVVGLYAGIGIGLVDRVHLIAAELPAAARGVHCVGDRGRDVRIGRRQQPQAHGHGGGEVLFIENEGVFVDAPDDILGPCLHVAGGAALEHHQKAVSTEAAAKIGGGELHPHQLRKLPHEILAREHADRILDVDEAVGFDVGELAYAALHAVGAARMHRGNQIALLQKVSRGVVLDRVRELHLEVVILVCARRYADARGRLALVIGFGQGEHERQARSVRKQGLNLEAVVRPFALQAGDERTFEGRMRFLLEQIHQRRAGQRIVAGIAEQLQPGAVGIHDDALPARA